jgi:hypothetical protein
MKTFTHFWRYLTKFFLEWEMFWAKVVDKIKTHILCSVTFFRKSYRLWDNVEKYGGERGATNDVTIWRIRVACWVGRATCTYACAHAHSPGYPHTFPRQQWSAKASLLRYRCIAALVIKPPSFCVRCWFKRKDAGRFTTKCLMCSVEVSDDMMSLIRDENDALLFSVESLKLCTDSK